MLQRDGTLWTPEKVKLHKFERIIKQSELSHRFWNSAISLVPANIPPFSMQIWNRERKIRSLLISRIQVIPHHRQGKRDDNIVDHLHRLDRGGWKRIVLVKKWIRDASRTKQRRREGDRFSITRRFERGRANRTVPRSNYPVARR